MQCVGGSSRAARDATVVASQAIRTTSLLANAKLLTGDTMDSSYPIEKMMQSKQQACDRAARQ